MTHPTHGLDPNALEAAPVAWRIRERPGFPWEFTDYNPQRMPNVRDWEAEPLYASPQAVGVGVKGLEGAPSVPTIWPPLETGSQFEPGDYAAVAERMTYYSNQEANLKAVMSNNFNIILAALNLAALSQNPGTSNTSGEAVPVAWIIHDDPELGDYLTRSADAAKRAGLPVTPLFAALEPHQGEQQWLTPSAEPRSIRFL